MSGNLQPLSSSPPGQNISVDWHMVGQLEGHLAPLGEMAGIKIAFRAPKRDGFLVIDKHQSNYV